MILRVEVVGGDDIRDFAESLRVDEHRAENRLLRLDRDRHPPPQFVRCDIWHYRFSQRMYILLSLHRDKRIDLAGHSLRQLYFKGVASRLLDCAGVDLAAVELDAALLAQRVGDVEAVHGAVKPPVLPGGSSEYAPSRLPARGELHCGLRAGQSRFLQARFFVFKIVDVLRSLDREFWEKEIAGAYRPRRDHFAFFTRAFTSCKRITFI